MTIRDEQRLKRRVHLFGIPERALHRFLHIDVGSSASFVYIWVVDEKGFKLLG